MSDITITVAISMMPVNKIERKLKRILDAHGGVENFRFEDTLGGFKSADVRKAAMFLNISKPSKTKALCCVSTAYKTSIVVMRAPAGYKRVLDNMSKALRRLKLSRDLRRRIHWQCITLDIPAQMMNSRISSSRARQLILDQLPHLLPSMWLARKHM